MVPDITPFQETHWNHIEYACFYERAMGFRDQNGHFQITDGRTNITRFVLNSVIYLNINLQNTFHNESKHMLRGYNFLTQL